MNEELTKSPHPKRIVCAVRGGPESRATVTWAINLALESHARLTFFHIVDAEFLGQTPTMGTLPVIYSELIEMAKFTMLILLERAQRRGVKQVDFLVRKGNIRQQLRRFVKQTSAEIMVMGRPVRSPGSNIFKSDEFDEFVASLESAGNVEVVCVHPKSQT